MQASTSGQMLQTLGSLIPLLMSAQSPMKMIQKFNESLGEKSKSNENPSTDLEDRSNDMRNDESCSASLKNWDSENNSDPGEPSKALNSKDAELTVGMKAIHFAKGNPPWPVKIVGRESNRYH